MRVRECVCVWVVVHAGVCRRKGATQSVRVCARTLLTTDRPHGQGGRVWCGKACCEQRNGACGEGERGCCNSCACGVRMCVCVGGGGGRRTCPDLTNSLQWSVHPGAAIVCVAWAQGLSWRGVLCVFGAAGYRQEERAVFVLVLQVCCAVQHGHPSMEGDDSQARMEDT
jgi:hypothetical protein